MRVRFAHGQTTPAAEDADSLAASVASLLPFANARALLVHLVGRKGHLNDMSCGYSPPHIGRLQKCDIVVEITEMTDRCEWMCEDRAWRRDGEERRGSGCPDEHFMFLARGRALWDSDWKRCRHCCTTCHSSSVTDRPPLLYTLRSII